MRTELKEVDLGKPFNEHGSTFPDGKLMEARVAALTADDDVTKKGEAYERQTGICPVCNKHFELSGMEADHITPWSLGGRTTLDNCQMLCEDANRPKTNV